MFSSVDHTPLRSGSASPSPVDKRKFAAIGAAELSVRERMKDQLMDLALTTDDEDETVPVDVTLSREETFAAAAADTFASSHSRRRVRRAADKTERGDSGKNRITVTRNTIWRDCTTSDVTRLLLFKSLVITSHKFISSIFV